MTPGLIIAFLLLHFSYLDRNGDGCISISEAPPFCAGLIGKQGDATVVFPVGDCYDIAGECPATRLEEKAISLAKLKDLWRREKRK